MTKKSKWVRLAEIYIETHGDQAKAPDNVTLITGPKRELEDNDVLDFMTAAAEREDPFFEQLEECIQIVAEVKPLRAIRLRKDIAWMRKVLAKEGHRWGKL